MDPNQSQSPFANIIARLQERKAQEEQQAQPTQTSQVPGQEQDQPENQLKPGEGAGNTKFLLMALKSLNEYVVAEDDSQNISIGRSIMQLLSKLIAKEQQELTQQIPQDQGMLQETT
jgi:hypothetical protein